MTAPSNPTATKREPFHSTSVRWLDTGLAVSLQCTPSSLRRMMPSPSPQFPPTATKRAPSVATACSGTALSGVAAAVQTIPSLPYRMVLPRRQ